MQFDSLEEYEDYLAKNEPRERIRTGLQGATFATADEMEAAIRSLPSLLTGDFGSTYEQTVGDIRKQLEEYQTAYPMESMAYEIGGAVVPTIAATMLTGGAGTAPATASTAARVAANPAMRTFLQSYAPSLLKGTGIGATEAGLYEFGSGEGGVSERLKGVPEAAAIGGALGPVFQLGGRALGAGLGLITNKAKNLFGAQSANVVEADLQRIIRQSGRSTDEILDAVARGETLVEISETTRKTLGAYLSDLSDAERTNIRRRAAQARRNAMRNTQQVLAGDVDVNVLKIFREGVKEADERASADYDEIFDKFGDLPESINTTLDDILTRNIDEAPQILKGLRLQGVKNPFFKVVKDKIEIVRTPTLREAERVRSALADLALNSKGQMKSDYKALELKLRNVIDEASPELGDVRAVWANTRRGAELFEQGRKVFSKSADEIEIDFEKVAQEGGDALAAYRQGVMDAIRNKYKNETSLPRLLTEMNNKEARIFAQVFPRNEYKKAYDLWDRARRSQAVQGEFGQAATAERLAIQARAGGAGDVVDIIETLGFQNPLAAVRLLKSKIGKSVGEKVSQDQQRQIARLLLSEDKDLVTRALKNNKGWDQVQKRILQIQKSLEAGARRAPAPIAEELGGEGLSELLF